MVAAWGYVGRRGPICEASGQKCRRGTARADLNSAIKKALRPHVRAGVLDQQLLAPSSPFPDIRRRIRRIANTMYHALCLLDFLRDGLPPRLEQHTSRNFLLCAIRRFSRRPEWALRIPSLIFADRHLFRHAFG